MAHDFQTVLNNLLIQLTSDNHSKQAAASAAVAILVNQAPEGTNLSPNVVPAVVPLLSNSDVLIQVCTAQLVIGQSGHGTVQQCYCREMLVLL